MQAIILAAGMGRRLGELTRTQTKCMVEVCGTRLIDRLLSQLSALRRFGRPLLVGVSRKSMIYKTLGITPEGALNGTTVLHTFALLHGADILRVHDVREAVECLRLVQMLNRK